MVISSLMYERAVLGSQTGMRVPLVPTLDVARLHGHRQWSQEMCFREVTNWDGGSLSPTL